MGYDHAAYMRQWGAENKDAINAKRRQRSAINRAKGVAGRLVTLRQKATWTQAHVASEIEVDVQAVIDWEESRDIPNEHDISLLAKLFGVSALYILTGRDDRVDPPGKATGKETFGERLQRLRENKQLSRDVVANRTGVTAKGVWRWETDECKPTIDNLVLLTQIMGVSMDYMMTGREYSKHAVLLEAVKSSIKANRVHDDRLAALVERL